MRSNLACLLILAAAFAHHVLAQDDVHARDKAKQDKPIKTDEAPALTIYNQAFAVVRQTLPLELKTGTNQVQLTDITSHLEPDSVILRDLKTGHDLRILEQDYRSDVASQARLLSLYEGKTIDFMVADRDGNRRAVPGKIIRSGYTPHENAY